MQTNSEKLYGRIELDSTAYTSAVAQPSPKKQNKPAASDGKSKTRAANGTKRKKTPTTASAAVTTQQPHKKSAPSAAAKQPASKALKPAVTPKTPHGGKRGGWLRIIPLGGLEEVGKNMTVYETEKDIIVVDCGLKFPDDELLGVDIVIPDYSYLMENRSKIRGVIITHAHEDHIGALPYFLRDIDAPVYATKLTIGLIKAKLKEYMNPNTLSMNVIVPLKPFKLGEFTVEAINVNHSIPDAVAFAIDTPQGTVLHTGDFKIDYSPLTDKPINLARIAEIGSRGVLAMLCDSTNAERPGYTPTEQVVSDSFEKLFSKASEKRIIIATFASNIQRIQRIFDMAKNLGRKLALSGRSMINYTTIANELGYLNIDKDTIIDIQDIGRYKDNQLMILTTGSQGEPLSALSRMASATHKQVSITPNDFIIISATPIPGNERLVNKTVNALLKWGSEVIYESMYETHVSGHACQEEIKTLLTLTAPKYFIPVHGEYKHLIKNAKNAADTGIPSQNILLPEIGNVMEFADGRVSRERTVPSGRVLVDGSGVGDVGSVVLRDRKHLAQDGLLIASLVVSAQDGEVLSGPEIISRGFVYVKESEQLMNEVTDQLKQDISMYVSAHKGDRMGLRTRIRDSLSATIYQKTKRSPMILPIVTEV